MEEFDVVILGAGPAGYVAGLRSAQRGFKTAVIEKAYLGGVCLNQGCIPTKTLLESARQINLIEKAEESGIGIGKLHIDLNKIWERKRKVVENLRRGIEYLFKTRGVTLFRGKAELIDSNTIKIIDGAGRIKAKNIVIAVGSSPAELPDLKFDHKNILSSDDILEESPSFSSLLIVGGGVIGCELASLFSSLGVRVTIVELLKNLLPQEDIEISQALEASFRKRGIVVITQRRVTKLDIKESTVIATLSDGTTIEVDKILVSVGRSPNTGDLGLENSGINLQKGWIVVDEYLRTSVPHIFAIGDTIGRVFLAHVAMFQGERVVENIEGRNKKMSYEAIPNCIYTFPEIATIGMKEIEAKERGLNYGVGKFPFRALGKAHTTGEMEGFLKVIIDKREEIVLGAHAIGNNVIDIIPELTLAIKNRIKIKDILETIHAHPTFSEIIPEAIFSSLNFPMHLA